MASQAIHTDGLQRETILISAVSLEAIDSKYGPRSPNPLAFHNAPHSLERCAGGIGLINLVAPYIAKDQLHLIYDLMMLGMAGHDYEQGMNPTSNVRVSARYMINLVERHGGKILNTRTSRNRLQRGTMSTEAHVDDTGRVRQPNVMKGQPDPLIFGMAFTDTGMIAIEGPPRMLSDSTSLIYERFADPTPQQLLGGLADQPQFIRQQFNDYLIKRHIAYHWRDRAKARAVYRAMHRAYNQNITAAYSLAKGIATNGIIIED